MKISRSTGTLLALGLMAGFALAGVTPTNGNYKVYDQAGTQIGNATVSDSGAQIGYVDNPNTSHPPDTNGACQDYDGDGVYVDGNGYYVQFTALESGGYVWQKRNAAGDVVDQGTMIPGGHTQPGP